MSGRRARISRGARSVLAGVLAGCAFRSLRFVSSEERMARKRLGRAWDELLDHTADLKRYYTLHDPRRRWVYTGPERPS
jgi:hypothetical protein